MGRQIELSDRLKAVAGLVTKGNVVCDVGCDHGFVSIYLVERGISPQVIAMDVNQGPLQAAKNHIAEQGMTARVETRISDGIQALLPGEADTLLCAGMGGRLMIRILEEGQEKLVQMQEMILQPQSELQEIRKYLRKRGYAIIEEDMVLEEGKYYPVIKALPGEGIKQQNQSRDQLLMSRQTEQKEQSQEQWQRLEDRYGPILLQKRHPVLQNFLQKEWGIYTGILEGLQENSRQKERRREILEKIQDIEQALTYVNQGE